MGDSSDPITTSAVTKMSSARLTLADLKFIENSVEGLESVAVTWSTREIYRVTASNFSAQSPAVKAVRTYQAKSIAEFTRRCPRGNIYIFEAVFKSHTGKATLTLGHNRDLHRDMILSYDGVIDSIPEWFNSLVSKLVSAKLLAAGQRELYLVTLTILPIIAGPALALATAFSDTPYRIPGHPLILAILAIVMLAYTTAAPTVVRLVRASNLRVKGALQGGEYPSQGPDMRKSYATSVRFSALRAEIKSSLTSGWQAFRYSDHQFNAVLIALVALAVSTIALIFQISK